jgi:hypothetical protein
MLTMSALEPKGKAKGGIARAASLTNDRKTEIAQKAALSRWGYQATHKGTFKEEFGIDVDCYVLNDTHKTAVISQRGMGEALGMGVSGSRLPMFVNSQTMAPYVGDELREKLDNPIVFQNLRPNNTKVHGYDVTILIDLCKVVLEATALGAKINPAVVKQSNIILNASAKAGIKGLVYALSGYNPTTEEVIKAFKVYVQEEAKKYEKEFPTELYIEWQRLYDIKPPRRGKNWKEMHLTIDHIYTPLAKSNGKLLLILREAKSSQGNRNTKLFQFLNEVGARALRMQLGRVLEMAESSKQKIDYEKKIEDRFGAQLSLNLPPSYPIS